MALATALAPTVAGSQDDPDADTSATDPTSDSDTATDSGTTTDSGFVATGGQLTLLEQSIYVAAEGDFSLRLGWSGAIHPDLSVAITIRGKLSRESQLGADTAVLNRPPVMPMTSVLQLDGSLGINVPIRSSARGAGDNGSERVLVPDPGVYPVTIEIRDSVGTIASMRTYLLRLPTETAEIDLLAVAVVIPVSSADGLTMTDVIGLLERHPTLPITVLLEAGVVSELLADPTAAENLQAALGNRTLLVESALSLDPSALAEVGHGDLYAEAIETSRSVLNDAGLTASTSMLPVEPDLTIEGAELLRALGITTMFDSEDGSTGVITTSNGTLRVVGVDEESTSLLTARSNTVEAAHLLIARLALRSEIDITPVLIGGSTLRQASLESIELLLAAQEGVGLLEPVSLAVFSEISPRLPIRPIENPSQNLLPVAGLIDESLDLIESYRGFHASGPVRPDIFRDELFAALARSRNPQDRERAIKQVDQQIRDTFEVVTIREGQSMTLTARKLTVPLSIESSAPGDRNVQLLFTSDKVEVAENGQTFTIPPGLTTLDITVEARALGLSPLGVTAMTPDGSQTLSSTSLRIRSTAVPGLGVLLSGAALVFLVSWWIVSIGRTRAQKHEAAAAAKTVDDDDAANSISVDSEATTPAI